jgi:hypothetical protein
MGQYTEFFLCFMGHRAESLATALIKTDFIKKLAASLKRIVRGKIAQV